MKVCVSSDDDLQHPLLPVPTHAALLLAPLCPQRPECVARAVTEKEHCLLLTLSFDIAVHLPFPWVSRTAHSLGQKHPSWMVRPQTREADPSPRVNAAAHSLLVDAFFTECAVTMTPKELAVCAVALAAKIVTGARIPSPFLELHASAALCGSFTRAILGTAMRAALATAPPAPTAAASAPAPAPRAAEGGRAAAGRAGAPGAAAARKAPPAEDGLPPPLDIFG